MVIDVDGGDERVNPDPSVPIQIGFSLFQYQTEAQSNLPNLADMFTLQPDLRVSSFAFLLPSLLPGRVVARSLCRIPF